jgi:branched-chain amino acid transport system ATP-binding protein
VINNIHARNMTIIWIEHIVHALASTVDRILVINFGLKLGEGPPQKILDSREFQEVYLGVEDEWLS